MIITSGNAIQKNYGGNKVFQDISFELMEKEITAIVGPNGSGKTTLFKLLANLDLPDQGVIHMKKGIKVGYLPQTPDYPDSYLVRDVIELAFEDVKTIEKKLTTLENQMSSSSNEGDVQKMLVEYGKLQDTFIRMGGYECEAELSAVAHGLQIERLLDIPFSCLSGGEKTKVCLGYILLKKCELLLLDEPTNHLDLTSLEWLEKYIKQYPGTIMIISHDRYFLDQVTNRILELEDCQITDYATNYTGYVRDKEQRLLQEFQDYKEQQKKIKKMQDTIRRLRQWANEGDNEKFYKKAKSIEKALERIDKIKKPKLERKKMKLEFEIQSRSGNDVLVYEEVSKEFDGRELFNQISFRVRHKEKVAIIGSNGSGKSTLLKMAVENLAPDTGTVRVGSNVKLGYLSQHSHVGNQEDTVIEVFRDKVQVIEGEARQLLAKFLFYGPSVYKKVHSLSGGERMRLRFAQLMHQDLNVLILDEPTNHLDIDKREVLEEALIEFEGTVICVSHDRFFLNKLFDQILWLDNGRLTSYLGNYDEAKEKKSSQPEITRRPVMKEAEPVNSKTLIESSKQNSSTSIDNIEMKIAKLEREIEQTEHNQHLIEQEMYQETDLEKLQSLQEISTTLQSTLDKLYKRLEQLFS